MGPNSFALECGLYLASLIRGSDGSHRNDFRDWSQLLALPGSFSSLTHSEGSQPPWPEDAQAALRRGPHGEE